MTGYRREMKTSMENSSKKGLSATFISPGKLDTAKL